MEYILPITSNIEIPQAVMAWALSYEYTGKTTLALNIARQIDKMIHQTHPTDDQFPMLVVYKDQQTILTAKVFNEIKTRKLTTFKNFGLTMLPKCSRVEMPNTLKDQIIAALPLILQQYNPTPVLQIMEGDGMLPHTDFVRKSSLYYLLTPSEGCNTMWYESNGTVDLHKDVTKYGFLYSIADLKHIVLTKTFNIKEKQWYVFDNHTFHAVKSSIGPIVRKSIQIEFNKLSATDLYKLLA